MCVLHAYVMNEMLAHMHIETIIKMKQNVNFLLPAPVYLLVMHKINFAHMSLDRLLHSFSRSPMISASLSVIFSSLRLSL